MTTFKSVALLVARLVLGVILIAHGWEKFNVTGIDNVSAFFESLNVPAADLAAPVVALLEIIGGVLILLGAFTTVVGIVLALLMVGAALFAHRGPVFLSPRGVGSSLVPSVRACLPWRPRARVASASMVFSRVAVPDA
ncbi:DoxX family protein [Corynebacterium glutamicum]|uniref:DoxX family protein n=1 Tax=Corynebacterium glutamicum TaxID=1718 RepID=UPI0039C0F7D2